jgi:hypothetical protein
MWLGMTGQSTQFRTIDTHKTTGITFFLELGMIFGIHGHTPTMPCAKTTFERLPRRRQRGVTWAYIPIPTGDQIFALAVPSRNSDGLSKPCILVVASLSWRKSSLLILVYSRSKQSSLVPLRLGPTIQSTLRTIAADTLRRFSSTRRPFLGLSAFWACILANLPRRNWLIPLGNL